MELKCDECGRELAARSTDAVAAGDVYEARQDDTRIYDWRGSGRGVLCTLARGTRLVAIDQLPPSWWKVAVQPGRWRAVVDPDLIVYPDLSAPEYVRVAGTCPEHLLPITTKLRQATEWWRR